MNTETILLAVELAGGKDPPKEFRIFPKGEIKTRKGTFLFDDEAARLVMAKIEEHGVQLCVDYGHAMYKAALVPPVDPAETYKSAAWFDGKMRDDGLYAADVSWTPPGETKLRNREYRYFSPTFLAKKLEDGRMRIVELLNVALTNVPATHKQAPLMADATDTEGDDDTMSLKLIALAAGLTDTTPEAEVVRAVKLEHDAAASLVTLSGAKDITAALDVIKSWKAEHDEIETIRLDARKAKVERLVQLKVDGGYLEPGKKESTIKMGLKLDEETFQVHLDGLTTKVAQEGGPVKKGQLPPPPAPPTGGGGEPPPSDEILNLLGMTREHYNKTSSQLVEGDG